MAQRPEAPLEFTYVNVTTPGCDGWLNLFFGEHVIALVNNKWLADEIRKSVKEKAPSTNR